MMMKDTQVVLVSEEPVTQIASLETQDGLEKLSTWQMVMRHRVAVFWSGFFALAAVNWGMDIQVSRRSRFNIHD